MTPAGERHLLIALALVGAVLLTTLAVAQHPRLLLTITNLLGALACLGAAAHVGASGTSRPALTLLVTAAVVGVLIHVAADGQAAAFLLFPALLAATYVLALVPVLVVSGLAIAVLAALLADEQSPAEFGRMLAALIGCLVLAHVYAVRLRRQRDQLVRISTVDALTGVLNRRALDVRLGEVVSQHKRVPSAQCLLVLDLDGFKAVNDRHGHDRGDEVLAQIATLVHGRIRVTDRLYRYGGDEFVVLATDSDLAHSRELAEELRALVSAEAGAPVTVSIGVAQYAGGESAAGWLRRADEALFRAKGAGRNRVEVAAAPVPAAVAPQARG